MKIFFIDGSIEPADSVSQERFNNVYIKIKEIIGNYEIDIEKVDAGEGFSNSIYLLDTTPSDTVVLTNQILALDHYYGWNKEENHTDIYLWKNNKFIRVDELTDRDIKYAHLIWKMYAAGEFGYGDEV